MKLIKPGLILGAILLLAGCGVLEYRVPTTAKPTSSVLQLNKLLADFAKALKKPNPTELQKLAASDEDSQRNAQMWWRNYQKLKISDLQVRYLTTGKPDQRAKATYGKNSSAITVQLNWKLPKERSPIHLEANFSLQRSSFGYRLVSAGYPNSAAQRIFWLTDPLEVTKVANSVIVASISQKNLIPELVETVKTAVRQVKLVFPKWSGKLRVEVPKAESALDEILGAQPGRYASIAAVTSPIDGSILPSAPTSIFINPEVFPLIGAPGAQVVVTHEAAHVATNANSSRLPDWLVEGFADYVAYANANISPQRAAGRFLAQVAANGPPKQLPTAKQLDPSAQNLGINYEAAWTICRYLANRFSETKLLQFYRAMNGKKLAPVLQEVLGISPAELLAGWQNDIQQLAANR